MKRHLSIMVILVAAAFMLIPMQTNAQCPSNLIHLATGQGSPPTNCNALAPTLVTYACRTGKYFSTNLQNFCYEFQDPNFGISAKWTTYNSYTCEYSGFFDDEMYAYEPPIENFICASGYARDPNGDFYIFTSLPGNDPHMPASAATLSGYSCVKTNPLPENTMCGNNKFRGTQSLPWGKVDYCCAKPVQKILQDQPIKLETPPRSIDQIYETSPKSK